MLAVEAAGAFARVKSKIRPLAAARSVWRLALNAGLLGATFAFLTFWAVHKTIETVPEAVLHDAVVGAPVAFTGVRELDLLRHLDARWYLDIAANGYSLDGPYAATQGFTNVVFFPLLPLLIRGASLATGLPVAMAGQVVVVLCTLGAAILFALYARDYVRATAPAAFASSWGQALPVLAVVALLVHPMGVFLQAIYPESLFLALCSGFLLAVRRQRLGLAAAAAFLLALTRPQGLFLPLVLVADDLIAAVEARRFRLSMRTVACGGAALLAVGLFATYLGLVTGKPWSFWTGRSAWDRDASVWNIPRLLAPVITSQFLLPKLILYATLAGAVMLWRRGERLPALLCGAFILLPLQKGNLGDIMRYSLLAAYAVLPWLALLPRFPALVGGGLGAGACLYGFYLMRFVEHHWVG